MAKVERIKNLKDILEGVACNLSGPQDCEISRIQMDSRKVEKGDLFFAVKGVIADGHKFIDKAVESGATAVLCEILPEKVIENIAYVLVENSSKAAGQIAANFYDHPSQKLKLIGVTGTNGKTTIASLLYQVFKLLGYKVGLISTIHYLVDDEILPSSHTTPDTLKFNQLLIEMLNKGCEYVFAECSSHAIKQNRLEGLHFGGGIFTNISHDHLDYHKTFDDYIKTKKTFFDNLPKTSFALSNIDDKRGKVMLQNTKAEQHTFGLQSFSDFKLRVLENSLMGMILKIENRELHVSLMGDFNASNILAVYATCCLLGIEKEKTLVALSRLKPAEGRFDIVSNRERQIVGVVDYAHTPDALEKILNSVSKLKKNKGQLICLVGAGGDRDKSKRPEMAKIAASIADRVILTSDNPRTEDPLEILKDMEAGIPLRAAKKCITIADRRQAIKTACMLAQNGDWILIAGKGHEKYQDINGVKHPFDDKEILREELE